MTTRNELLDNAAKLFAKMDVREPWLCKAVTGNSVPKHTSIRRVELLRDLLVKHVIPACDGQDVGSLIKGQDSEDEEEDPNELDPMDEVQVTEAAPAVAGNKRKRNAAYPRRNRNSARGKFLKCEMPEKCPEAFPDCGAKRIVRLYVHYKRTVWLLLKDVDWAVKYMYAQNVLKGVASVAQNDAGLATP